MSYFVLLPGSTDTTNILCRPLIGGRAGRSPQMPWLAVATGVEAGAFTLMERAGLSASDAQATVDMAQKHLDAQVYEWTVAEQSGFLWFKRPSTVRAIVPGNTTPSLDVMDDLSAELIASPSALRAAAEMLRTLNLIAIVPKRGWLLVVLGVPGEFPQMMKMAQAAGGIFGRAGAQALSPYGFFIKDGEVIGVNIVEGSSGSLSLFGVDENAWEL